jgi:diguanylate cyclase (GGDEF)-like protein/PAS domain S-box-containing protein
MIFSVVLGAMLVGYSGFLYWQLYSQKNRLQTLGSMVATALAQDFVRLILFDDLSVAADTSSRLAAFSVVQRALLYSPQGRPLYQYQRPGSPSLPPLPLPKAGEQSPFYDKGNIGIFVPVHYAGSEQGILYLQMEADSVWTLLKRDQMALFPIGGLALIFALGMAIRHEAAFNAPILHLVRFLERVGKQPDTPERLETRETNEFGQLYREVNAMLDRVAASREALRVAAVAFETPSAMIITDAQNRILRVNDAFTRITGYRADEVLGKTPAVLRSGRHSEAFYKGLWADLSAADRWEGEIWNRRKEGDVFPQKSIIQRVRNTQGDVAYHVAAFVDLSSLKAAEAKVAYLGSFDPLTGLANRYSIGQQVTALLDEARQEQQYGALLCVDLKELRRINDTLGHEAGDLLLVAFANRLRQGVGIQDMFIGRLGSDEFVVVCPRLGHDPEKVTIETEILAEKTLRMLEKPYDVEGKSVRCQPCVGIALFPSAADAEELIRQADLALHQAKDNTARPLAFFDHQAETLARRSLDIQMAIEQALVQDGLRLLCQPLVDETGKTLGGEALLRCWNPEIGLISPVEFIPVAERTGLIVPMGMWVLRTALARLALWQSDPLRGDWVLAVNVSARQFQEPSFVDEVRALVAEAGVCPNGLKLELTEAMLVDDIEATISRMTALKDMGIGLSLDDFGTGYSSLRYLKRLPLTQVKIDQSFVRDMLQDPSDVAIIQSILSLGHSLGLSVVAEGVETQAQFERLNAMGCRIFQGYLFSKPVPVETFKTDYGPDPNFDHR